MKVSFASVVAVAWVIICLPTVAEPKTVFDGRPSVRVATNAEGSKALPVPLAEASNLHCVISLIDGKLYWASRENRPMTVFESGAFFVFVADGGAGYVKVIKPDMKEAASLFGETETRYDYVEHLTLGLGSMTYYGKFAE